MATRGKSSLIWNTGEPADQLVSCFAIKLMKQGVYVLNVQPFDERAGNGELIYVQNIQFKKVYV
ncbi:hypothetical protein TRIUR3_26751 [Triticum urartu]|uniref:Uncharacterized protein n=3 Tax=Triticum TaxID=4564 RepID=A0A9R0SB33_TRITD|nr:hypothetical protein TRIUR3_26751 [Triticum urartu]VAH91198.1 unnamed protein product [Triticum turgidum subsp. durum]